MQGVIAKPCFYAPGALNHRYRKHVHRPIEVSTTFSLPLRKMFPSLKSKAISLHVAALSAPVLNKHSKEDNFSQNLQLSPLKRGSYLPRASKDKLFSFPPYPPMTEKPKWWWRSLACLPYLMNFLDQLTWAHAHPLNNPPPFLQNFDNLVFPLHSSLLTLPKFVLSCYPIMYYFWIVRRKEWPHFFRFHVINAMLLGVLVQVIGVSGNWFPSKFSPPHFWSAATLFFLFTVLECVGCALAGVYPSIPFVKDAALLHSDLNIR
ncbi:protein TIC 20-I, chloroplastic [Beta vulgaris subsp. vulgaris]|uniref:protein TIC 20-I, chloroplastic n=1 Tax=Beta vulgaris subsp. vulgaris TaxID=3555 RepID=UPI0020368008|nr:protein TIC 20-I, chloroplastic [Beta vulgaris subsp. vulgaris]